MPKTIERGYPVFLLLLPFVYVSQALDPVLMPRQFFVSFFILILAGALYFQKITVPFLDCKKPILLAISGYFLFSILPFFSRHFTSESHAVLSKQLLFFSFLILTTALLGAKILSRSGLIIMGIGFGLIAVGSAAVQIIGKTIAGESLFHEIQIIEGLFANKNLLSSLLFLSLSFFCMGLQEPKKIKRISFFGLLLAVFIIIIIRTRVVLVASIIFLAMHLYFYSQSRFKISKKRSMLLGFALVAGMAAFYNFYLKKNIAGLQPSENAAQQYFYRIFDAKTLRERTQFWENSMAMFKENPFGVGLGNWQAEFPKYGLEQFKDYNISNGISTLQRPHNDFLNVLCESGIFGFLTYLAIFGIVFYQLFSLIRHAENTSEKWKFIAIFAGISGYVVISFFDFPAERIEHQVLLMVLFSITISAYYRQQINPVAKQSIYILSIVFSAVYSLVVSGFRWYGEAESKLMYLSKTNGQWDEMLYHANKADSYFYKTDPTSIPIDWYKGVAYFNRNEIGESLHHFENAYQIAPYQIQVINNLATAYLSNKELERSEQLYKEALQISPEFEEAQLNLVAVYYNSQQFDKAFAMIDKIDIHSENDKYGLYLVPVLQKKLNQILAEHSDIELSKRIAAHITTSKKIKQLYFDSKNSKMDFKAYVVHRDLILP